MVLIEKDNYQLHFIVFSTLSIGPAVDAIEKLYSGYGTGKVALVCSAAWEGLLLGFYMITKLRFMKA